MTSAMFPVSLLASLLYDNMQQIVVVAFTRRRTPQLMPEERERIYG
jgi:hypothetical protein